MNKFRSFLAPLIIGFLFYLKASRHGTESSLVAILRIFDSYCLKNYPDAQVLSQDMVDNWCKKRDTEQNNSYKSRISGVLSFLLYLKRRNETEIVIPQAPRQVPRTYVPHSFTQEELQSFFNVCDSLSVKDSPGQKARKLILPVYFRLLYSSGIRTTEARQLRVKDVDFTNGILSICLSKGSDQHFVALHDEMLELMIAYEAAISRIYPGRTYFFPNGKDGFHNREWIQRNFRKCWDKNNTSHATPYELRHHYAIENINRWQGDDLNMNAKLLYLSKSMGHRAIASTLYYYSLVPRLADVLCDKTNDSFNHIIREAYCYETNK